MDLAQLETYAEAMQRLGLTRLRIREGDREFEIEAAAHRSLRSGGVEAAIQSILPTPAAVAPAALVVPSPLVGLFYSRPSPSQPPFLQIGQRITPQTVIGIVEAMKVMNEIKAGVEGVFEGWGPSDGDPVEYGTPLIRYAAETSCKKS